MNNADRVKEAGFKSVKEFAGLVGVTPRTIQNWAPQQIADYILFAKLRKEIQKDSKKAQIILAMLEE